MIIMINYDILICALFLLKVTVNGTCIQNGLSVNTCNKKVAAAEELNENIVLTSRKQYGLPDNAVVFCNFNQLYKTDPSILEMWVNILKKVPNSVLWLLSFPAAGEPNVHKFTQKLGTDLDCSFCSALFDICTISIYILQGYHLNEFCSLTSHARKNM